MIYYYDATALGSNYAVNDQDFHYNVVKEFERHGWRIESFSLGYRLAAFPERNPMHHDEKYLLINNAFAGKQRLMPFFNHSNTAPMAPARFLPFGRSYFVVDTLYIGCEKFPYHDTFAINIGGVF